jgi:hypothetical protein
LRFDAGNLAGNLRKSGAFAPVTPGAFDVEYG